MVSYSTLLESSLFPLSKYRALFIVSSSKAALSHRKLPFAVTFPDSYLVQENDKTDNTYFTINTRRTCVVRGSESSNWTAAASR
jgi:hypothetical protein